MKETLHLSVMIYPGLTSVQLKHVLFSHISAELPAELPAKLPAERDWVIYLEECPEGKE
jgi:hypothetical protein